MDLCMLWNHDERRNRRSGGEWCGTIIENGNLDDVCHAELAGQQRS
jgi:hypothetical protein